MVIYGIVWKIFGNHDPAQKADPALVCISMSQQKKSNL